MLYIVTYCKGPHNWRLSLWLVPARIVCKFRKVLVLFMSVMFGESCKIK
jgi:hypothetical protein